MARIAKRYYGLDKEDFILRLLINARNDAVIQRFRKKYLNFAKTYQRLARFFNKIGHKYMIDIA
jgi:hypothetical protein